MKSKGLIVMFFVIIAALLLPVSAVVYEVDPYFHYRVPKTDKYYYELDKERAQNYGIEEHFEFDAFITGTSMTECFKTSKFDELFGTNSVKISFSGARFKESDENIKRTLEENPDVKIVVRDLSLTNFIRDKDEISEDGYNPPTYLYDDNPLTDVNYLFNKAPFFDYSMRMKIDSKKEGFTPGITSFDEYKNWSRLFPYGYKSVTKGVVKPINESKISTLKAWQKTMVLENVQQNVIQTAKEHEDVTFYYFVPPYSIAYWADKYAYERVALRYADAAKTAAKEILEQENIKLYFFPMLTDITSDLNNYKDRQHHGEWINDLILQYMAEGKCLLTKDNYEEIIDSTFKYVDEFDFYSLLEQEDYENDAIAEALVREEVTGISPVLFDKTFIEKSDMKNARITTGHNGKAGIICKGSMKREPGSDKSAEECMLEGDYSGIKIEVDDIGQYDYLVFYGQKIKGDGQILVTVYAQSEDGPSSFFIGKDDLDNEMHDYCVWISRFKGKATIIFNGAYIDNTGADESEYLFSDIGLY